MAGTAGLVDRLRAVVGPAHVLTDPAVTNSYLSDWTGRFRGHARCVVQPADTREVAEVMAVCAAAGVPMVVQGGNTGLVGGATPMAGEVLLSLIRLTDLGPVDRVSGQVVAGAGVRLAALQEHARAVGTEFGVDLGARGSPRSAASSPPTPAATRYCATAPPGRRCSGWRRCCRTVRSSPGWGRWLQPGR